MLIVCRWNQVMAGDFPVVNPHLLKDLTNLGLWTPEMKHRIMAEEGRYCPYPHIKEQSLLKQSSYSSLPCSLLSTSEHSRTRWHCSLISGKRREEL